MRRLVAVAPFALLLSLLSACGGNDKPASAPVGFPGETWSLEYIRSGGGIGAGIYQRLLLDSRGNLETQSRRLQPRKGLLAPSEVSTLRRTIEAADLPSLKSDQGLPRPDLIVTSIKVTARDRTYGAKFIAMPPSREVAELFARLEMLYEENRP